MLKAILKTVLKAMLKAMLKPMFKGIFKEILKSTNLIVVHHLGDAGGFLIVAGNDGFGRNYGCLRNKNIVDETSVAIRRLVRSVVGQTDPLDDGVSLTVGVGLAPAALVAVDVERSGDDERRRKFDFRKLFLFPVVGQELLDVVLGDERRPDLGLTLLRLLVERFRERDSHEA
jgi:hypothetical protein